ncbi:hypothetical protein HYPSUDRAFT_210141 [Hypholoma sublateritium FD-334 SS-4]|uniref:Uncharacterized protein n=1 Tax=Hypholoma sublateritium (strain FD-334 SS-4) TaxID=945553 RepID=A0A0D2KE18_HYPSF|nr:hypothetical protein HYPSUDRAFT_210141 [Hypholoma sublateritium FD-334 SS-4]
MDDDEAQRARTSRAVREGQKEKESKRVTIPDIVPGYKENVLGIAVSAKVDEAIAAFKYIPYTSLTKSAKIKALHSNEEFVINAQGGLTSKQLDRKAERFISLSDWLGASRVMEDRLRVHLGNVRADAFAAHHRIVLDIERTHGWAIAVDYDIQQRDFPFDGRDGRHSSTFFTPWSFIDIFCLCSWIPNKTISTRVRFFVK